MATSDHDLPPFSVRSRRTQAPVPHFVVVRDQPSPDETNDTERGDVREVAVAAPAVGTGKESKSPQNKVLSAASAVVPLLARYKMDLLVIPSARRASSCRGTNDFIRELSHAVSLTTPHVTRLSRGIFP
jgi:hypothetical protein